MSGGEHVEDNADSVWINNNWNDPVPDLVCDVVGVEDGVFCWVLHHFDLPKIDRFVSNTGKCR